MGFRASNSKVSLARCVLAWAGLFSYVKIRELSGPNETDDTSATEHYTEHGQDEGYNWSVSPQSPNSDSHLAQSTWATMTEEVTSGATSSVSPVSPNNDSHQSNVTEDGREHIGPSVSCGHEAYSCVTPAATGPTPDGSSNSDPFASQTISWHDSPQPRIPSWENLTDEEYGSGVAIPLVLSLNSMLFSPHDFAGVYSCPVCSSLPSSSASACSCGAPPPPSSSASASSCGAPPPPRKYINSNGEPEDRKKTPKREPKPDWRYTCFGCGKKGHHRADCPRKRNRDNGQS